MKFGSLVHTVLEHVEKAASERGDQHGTAEEAVAILDEIVEPGAFGDGAFDAAWWDRARVALENIYSLWPGVGRPVGSETELEVHRDEARWIGKADRIEERGGSLAIVDYKTGQLTSRDDAASSLQLGFYLIGARETPGISALGPATEAEMWFPMSPQKRSIAKRPFDISNLDDVEARMATVAAGIGAEDWTPTPGPECNRCDLRAICPAMPEGKEAFAV